MVGRIYQALVQRGYRGPAPAFDERWRTLFARTSDLIGRDRRRPPAVA